MKWRIARYYFIGEAFLTLISLILLFIHSARYRGAGVLVPLVVIQLWTLLVETVEIHYERLVYWLSFSNYIDLLRIGVTFVYFFLVAGGAFTDRG